jgi:hypothetical protein
MSPSIFALLLFVIALAFKGGIALNILTAGNALFGNQTQYLSNSGYYLVMQPDCNLVMYRGSSLATSHQVWQTSTAGNGSDCWLTMQAVVISLYTMQLVVPLVHSGLANLT